MWIRAILQENNKCVAKIFIRNACKEFCIIEISIKNNYLTSLDMENYFREVASYVRKLRLLLKVQDDIIISIDRNNWVQK